MSGPVREILAAHGRDVLKARRRVLRSGGGKAVHDLRVATRRLQAALEVFGPKLPVRPRARLERRARRLRRSLGERRNAAVLVDLLDELLPRLKGGERRVADGLRGRLKRTAHGSGRHGSPGHIPRIRKRIRRLLGSLSGGIASGAPASGGGAPSRTTLVLQACERARDGAPESMHRLRLAVKRHRYALEILAETGVGGLAPEIRQARRLQGDLGRLHDLDVLIEVTRREVHRKGAPDLLRRLLRLRSRQATKALERVSGFRPGPPAPTRRFVPRRPETGPGAHTQGTAA